VPWCHPEKEVFFDLVLVFGVSRKFSGIEDFLNRIKEYYGCNQNNIFF
jgi:hypothetical protein